MEDLICWRQDGNPEVHHLLPSRRLLQSSFYRGFSYAGLSPDCNMAFFQNDTTVCLYPVTNGRQGVPSKDPILEQKFGKNNHVVNVSLSNSLVAVSTRTRLELSWISPQSPEPRTEIPHGDWEPSGLAVHEERSEVFVAIGYHRQLKGSREGLVTLYDVKLPAAIRATTTRKYKLPMGDFPRSLLFDSHGESLTCITEIRNLILVWKLADPNPFVCSRYQHQPVSLRSSSLTNLYSLKLMFF